MKKQVTKRIKDLEVRDDRVVKGGVLKCCTGQHIPEATITVR